MVVRVLFVKAAFVVLYGCGQEASQPDPERGVTTGTPPPTEICGDGIENDGDGQIDEGCEPPPTSTETLVGVGDIASCSNTNDTATANVVKTIPGTVFTLGDNAYDSGTATEFAKCYDPTWGAFKARTRPAPGNHDYGTSGATPYYNYFGSLAGPGTNGWYSYNVGSAVHVVSLNSLCQNEGGCDATSPMNTFLKNDLMADNHTCDIAMWHHPVATSSDRASQTADGIDWTQMVESYKIADAQGVDLVLNGHEHMYERFGRMSISGSNIVANSNGPVEVIAGMGGRDLEVFGATHSGSQARSNSSFGVLKLTVDGTKIHGQFVPATGSFTDSFDVSCS